MKLNTKFLKPFEEFLEEKLQDPKFREVWEADEARRKVVSALIEERIKKKLSQRQLAEQIGIKQPSLARIESGASVPSLSLLQKVAKALGMRIEVRLVQLA